MDGKNELPWDPYTGSQWQITYIVNFFRKEKTNDNVKVAEKTAARPSMVVSFDGSIFCNCRCAVYPITALGY